MYSRFSDNDELICLENLNRLETRLYNNYLKTPQTAWIHVGEMEDVGLYFVTWIKKNM